MSLISDNKGDTNFFDFGDVSLRESVTSTAFFVGSAAAFSNFDVSLPTGGNNIIDLTNEFFSTGVPLISNTAVFSYAMTIVVLLLGYELYDNARRYGRSNDFTFSKWLGSIPAGLTVLLGVSVIPVIGQVLGITAITSIYAGDLLLQFIIIALHTATYWALIADK